MLVEVESLVANLYLEIGLVAGFFGHTGIDRELVGLALLDRNAKETFVLDSCMLDAMAREVEAGIVWIAVEGAVVANLDIACRIPSHPGILKFERAVLDHFGIEAAIGSEVDVLKEDAVHRGLDYCTRFGRLDVERMCNLCCDGAAERGSKECQ